MTDDADPEARLDSIKRSLDRIMWLASINTVLLVLVLIGVYLPYLRPLVGDGHG